MRQHWLPPILSRQFLFSPIYPSLSLLSIVSPTERSEQLNHHIGGTLMNMHTASSSARSRKKTMLTIALQVLPVISHLLSQWQNHFTPNLFIKPTAVVVDREPP
jgi:hypothetical protein